MSNNEITEVVKEKREKESNEVYFEGEGEGEGEGMVEAECARR